MSVSLKSVQSLPGKSVATWTISAIGEDGREYPIRFKIDGNIDSESALLAELTGGKVDAIFRLNLPEVTVSIGKVRVQRQSTGSALARLLFPEHFAKSEAKAEKKAKPVATATVNA